MVSFAFATDTLLELQRAESPPHFSRAVRNQQTTMRVLTTGVAILGAAAAMDLNTAPAITQELVDTINNMGTTWKAAIPSKFQNGKLQLLRRFGKCLLELLIAYVCSACRTNKTATQPYPCVFGCDFSYSCGCQEVHGNHPARRPSP